MAYKSDTERARALRNLNDIRRLIFLVYLPDIAFGINSSYKILSNIISEYLEKGHVERYLEFSAFKKRDEKYSPLNKWRDVDQRNILILEKWTEFLHDNSSNMEKILDEFEKEKRDLEQIMRREKWFKIS